jgi:hypothetical protein
MYVFLSNTFRKADYDDALLNRKPRVLVPGTMPMIGDQVASERLTARSATTAS